jgi:hypothetical protein
MRVFTFFDSPRPQWAIRWWTEVATATLTNRGRQAPSAARHIANEWPYRDEKVIDVLA